MMPAEYDNNVNVEEVNTCKPTYSIQTRNLDKENCSEPGNDPTTDEDQPLITSDPANPSVLYHRRWYILAVFSVVAFTQGVVWNTWGPLAQSGRDVFGWGKADIALLANWGPMMYLLTCLPFSYIIDVKGLRVSAVSATFFILVGSACRCFTMKRTLATWFIHVGQAVNGLAGPICFGGPPVLSDVWFPPGQRATATAFSVLSSYLGVAVAYIIGISFVHERTGTTNTSQAVFINNTDIERESEEISRLVYAECIWSGVLFLVVLCYFPDKPPTPPSRSAATARIHYRDVFPKLIRNKQLLVIGVSSGLSAGIYGTWASVLDTNLHPFGISQKEAGHLGFYSTLAACVSGVIICRFSDIFTRRMRTILLCLAITGTVSYLWFTLLCQKIIPFSTVCLYLACILGGMVINSAIPLYYEFGCDCGYPIPEGASATYLTILNNVVGFLFYMVLQIPGTGTIWMNWALVGAVGSGILLLLMTQENYERSQLDSSITHTQIIH